MAITAAMVKELRELSGAGMTVSYTHLDVYKRQVSGSAGCAGEAAAE